MKYYHPVEIDNLPIIQEKVYALFPRNMLRVTSLFYIPDNLNLFFGIPELKHELDKLGWTPHVDMFGFYIIQKTNGTTLHTDTGNRTYSFNIPIKGCVNTKLNFYTTDSLPVEAIHAPGVPYAKYEPENCTLVDSLEMNIPHVINVKEVHNIANPNYQARITLLVRLKNTLDLSHIFS